MKQISIIFILAFMIGVSTANAEIKRGVDDFEESVTINSNNLIYSDRLGSISLQKNISANPFFLLTISNDTFKDNNIEKKDIGIKIDKNFSYLLQVKEYQTFTPIREKILVYLTVKVPTEVIDNLKKANRVTLRFTQNNGSTFTYVLPDNILTEWKEVINTEE